MALRYDFLFFVEYFTSDLIVDYEEMTATHCHVHGGRFHPHFGANLKIFVTGGYDRCYLVHVCAYLHW